MKSFSYCHIDSAYIYALYNGCYDARDFMNKYDRNKDKNIVHICICDPVQVLPRAVSNDESTQKGLLDACFLLSDLCQN